MHSKSVGQLSGQNKEKKEQGTFAWKPLLQRYPCPGGQKRVYHYFLGSHDSSLTHVQPPGEYGTYLCPPSPENTVVSGPVKRFPARFQVWCGKDGSKWDKLPSPYFYQLTPHLQEGEVAVWDGFGYKKS